jgi:hypothetical protein
MVAVTDRPDDGTSQPPLTTTTEPGPAEGL